MKGQVTKNAAKKETFKYVKNVSCKAVNDSGTDRRLIFTALQETFLTYLKVSFFAAFFVTCPYMLVQIWKFIAPGLYKHEKIAVIPYLVLTPILFFFSIMFTENIDNSYKINNGIAKPI